MGILIEKKSLLLEDISLEVRHSDGDTHLLKWAGITEIHSEISDQNGNKQVITKEPPDRTYIFSRFTQRKIHKVLRAKVPRARLNIT